MSTQFFTLAYAESRAMRESNPAMNTGSAINASMVMLGEIVQAMASGDAEQVQKAAVMLGALSAVMYDRNNKPRTAPAPATCECENCRKPSQTL